MNGFHPTAGIGVRPDPYALKLKFTPERQARGSFHSHVSGNKTRADDNLKKF